jgi:hypothetical protein
MRWSMVVLSLGLCTASAALAQPPPVEALPEILQLQLDQHSAWRSYKDAVAEERAEAAGEAGRVAGINALPTPARLDALQDQLRRRDAAFQRQAEATRAFYAVLSPEQRRTFDAVTRLPAPPPPTTSRPSPQPRSSFRVPTDGQGRPLLPPPTGVQ